MKRNLLGISALILGLAFSAFTTSPSTSQPSGGSTSTFYWFDAASNSYTQRQSTKAVEVPLSGCANTGQSHCENGYIDADLLVSGDPDAGLSSSAQIRDFIPKP